MISTGGRTMSKFYIAFSPINVRVMVFKPFVLKEKIGFPKFGYCYNHLFLMIIHSELYFDVVCYWSSLVYAVISVSYKNWFNNFLGTNVVFPNKFL